MKQTTSYTPRLFAWWCSVCFQGGYNVAKPTINLQFWRVLIPPLFGDLGDAWLRGWPHDHRWCLNLIHHHSSYEVPVNPIKSLFLMLQFHQENLLDPIDGLSLVITMWTSMGLPPNSLPSFLAISRPPVASPQAMTVPSSRRAAKALSLGPSGPDAAETDTMGIYPGWKCMKKLGKWSISNIEAVEN